MFHKTPSQVLAKTDPKNEAQMQNAVECMKKWTRSKLKKGALREVAGRGGKIEQLEIEFARRGFQDVFYLTRFELSLPPSRLNLPPPSPPVAKILSDANWATRSQSQPTASGSDPSKPRSSGDGRKEVLVDEENTRTVPSSSREEKKRMTLGVREITWGKQDGTPKMPSPVTPTNSKKNPSSPPSPILYVPPRPPPPEESKSSLDSPIHMAARSPTSPALESPTTLGAGVASTRPVPGAGVASTAGPPRLPPVNAIASSSTGSALRSSNLLNPSSATKTPTKLPSPGQPTPSTVNEPLPITPTSARTSSLGWPHGSTNFRVSQYNFGPGAQASPTPAPGPRRGSDGQPHVPHELKVQQPQHRRPSAPFLTVAPDPSLYHQETKETLSDDPPKIPELPQIPLSAKSDPGTKGKQSTHKAKTSDPFVMDDEEIPAAQGKDPVPDSEARKELEMKKQLEEKIKALQSELETLEAAKLKEARDAAMIADRLQTKPISNDSPTAVKPADHAAERESKTTPSKATSPTKSTATSPPLSVGQGHAPTIPLPPLPLATKDNRRPKPPPLNLQHSNMGSFKSEKGVKGTLAPDESATTVKTPSPLRASTIPEPVRSSRPNPPKSTSSIPPLRPARPQRPPEGTIPSSVRSTAATSAPVSPPTPGPSVESRHHPTPSQGSLTKSVSQSSSLAPSPTIISKALKQPMAVAQAQAFAADSPTSKSSPLPTSTTTAGLGLIAPKATKDGAPRLSFLEPSSTFLADNWLSDLDSGMSAFDLETSPVSPISMPSFPPPPARQPDTTNPPQSAPATQTKMKFSYPTAIDLDTDPRLVGKSMHKSASRSANSTPVVGYDASSPLTASSSSNSVGQGLPRSLHSFPPRSGSSSRNSPKTRSHSLPGGDEHEIARPYGRPSPVPTHEPLVSALGATQPLRPSAPNGPTPGQAQVQKQHTTTPSGNPVGMAGRQPVNAALAASPASRMPRPSRPAPVPVPSQQVSGPNGTAGRAKVANSGGGDGQMRKVQGYRQSISARYANKLQVQPQKPVQQPQLVNPPHIVEHGAEYMTGEGGEEDDQAGGGWVGFAV